MSNSNKTNYHPRHALLLRHKMLGEELSTYCSNSGWTLRGLAKHLTFAGQLHGLTASEGTLGNIVSNRHRILPRAARRNDREKAGTDVRYPYVRKPWNRTLRALLLLNDIPNSMREVILDLLDFEGRVLAPNALSTVTANENAEMRNFRPN